MSFARKIDVSSLVETRINIFILSLHLLGLSAEDKQKININSLYKHLFGKDLKSSVGHELLQNPELKNQNLTHLKNQLTKNLTSFALGQQDGDIKNFLNSFIDSEVCKNNVDGAKIFFNQYYQEMAKFFKNDETFVNKSKNAWVVLIEKCFAKKSYTEFFERDGSCSRGMMNAGVIIFGLIVLQFLYQSYTQKSERDIKNRDIIFLYGISILIISTVIASCLPGPKAVIVPKIKTLPDKNIKEVDEVLQRSVTDFVKVHLQKLQEIEEKEKAKKSLEALTPSTKPTFVEETKSEKAPKRNKTSSSPSVETMQLSNPIPQQAIHDEKHGNIYYPLIFQHKKNCFFRFNHKEITQLLEKNGIEAKTVLDKMENAVQNEHVNAPGAKLVGVTQVKQSELKKFPGRYKLRILDDPRLALAIRTELNDWERENEMAEVMSPKGVELHTRSRS